MVDYHLNEQVLKLAILHRVSEEGAVASKHDTDISLRPQRTVSSHGKGVLYEFFYLYAFSDSTDMNDTSSPRLTGCCL